MKKLFLIPIILLLSLVVVSATYDDTNLSSYWTLDTDSTDFYGSLSGSDTDMNYQTDINVTNGSAWLNNGAGGTSGSAHIDLGASSNWNVGSNHYSIQGWFYKNASATNPSQGIWMSGDGYAEANFKIALYYGGANDVLSYVRKGSSQDTITTVTNDDTWYFITVGWDGADMYMFVNGAEVNRTSSAGSIASHSVGSNACFGAMECDSDTELGFFSGYLDEWAFYNNRDITLAEHQSAYNGGIYEYPYPVASASITNDQPVDNDHDNNATIYFNATTSDLDGESCELFLNTTSYGNATASSDSVSKGITPLVDSVFEWYFLCGSTYSTTNSTFVYDTTNPLYTENTLVGNTTNYDVNISSSYNVTFTGNMTDTYLFAWNYTIYDSDYNIKFSNQTTNLTTNNETITHFVDIGSYNVGTYTQNVTVSDDHTAKRIENNYDITNTQNSLVFNTPTNRIEVQSEIGNLKGFTTNYETDRYTFGFISNNARTEWGFNLFCDDTLYYRGSLYEYPVFVCGSNWVDFNIIGNSVESVEVKGLSNGGYNINIKTTQSSDRIDFQSIGGLNIVSYINTFTIENIPSLTLSSIKSVNSSGEYDGEFNTTNLEEIEKMELSFIVNGGGSVLSSDWYFNFTADGTDACALGNRQNTQCYDYHNNSFQWIKFLNNSLTNTFDATVGVSGDNIEVTTQNTNSSYLILNLTIDEHYNPNVLKGYGLLNFSDELYQDGVNERITGNNLFRTGSVSGAFLSLEADFYKLDFRANFSTPEPTQPLNAYACNFTYSTGHPALSPNCVLVASKDPSEFQDDGTKFRAIVTNDVIETLGAPVYIIMSTDENNPNRYYSMKTYGSLNLSAPQNTLTSTDNGATWNNLSGGYRSEANVNWFFDGVHPTAFVGNLYYSTLSGASNTLFINKTWDIDPSQLYPPIVDITTPMNDEIIPITSFPYNITFSATDFNSEELNVTLYFNNSILISDMNQSNTSYLWNNSALGDYNLTLYAEKLSDSSYNDSITFNISIQDVPLPPLPITVYGECVNVTVGSASNTSFTINMSSTTDPNGDNFTHDIYFKNYLSTYLIKSDLGQYTTVDTFEFNKSTLINNDNYSIQVHTIDDTNLSILSNSTCTFGVCVNNWVPSYTTCTNDTQLVTYNDSNSCSLQYDIPANNGTFITCDDSILSDSETAIRTTMLLIIFILFVLLIFVQIMNINPMVTFASSILGVMTVGGLFFLLDSEYLVVPIVLLIFQMVIVFINIRMMDN